MRYLLSKMVPTEPMQLEASGQVRQKVIKPACNMDIALFQNSPSGRLVRAVGVGIKR